jgi:hypothetical protein
VADRPTKLELLEAVQRFLDSELMPELEGVRRFHTRVASNVLGIVRRELELQGEQLPERFARLAGLLERSEAPPADPEALAQAVEALEAEVCERIRAGEADAGPWRDTLLRHLEADVRERLLIDNPRYSD